MIGAGPAGCAAAKILAESGRSVTLIERCGLPRNKSCSGVLIGKTLELVTRIFGEIPREVLCTPAENRGMVFFDDVGREYRFAQKGLNVWRDRFDFWLFGLARKQGAEAVLGKNVISVSQGDGFAEITLAGGERLRARFVIDCSGGTSGFRKGALRQKEAFVYTYQVFYRGSSFLDPHYFYAFTDPRFSEYDAWYNVKDGMPVVGVAVKNPENAKRFHKKFVEYLRDAYGLSISETVREERWVMPHIRPHFVLDYGEGRVLRAGEAAGFLNPMGEGISAALESGMLAANAISACEGQALAIYSESVKELRAYMLRQWRLLSFLSERFRGMRGDH